MSIEIVEKKIETLKQALSQYENLAIQAHGAIKVLEVLKKEIQDTTAPPAVENPPPSV